MKLNRTTSLIPSNPFLLFAVPFLLMSGYMGILIATGHDFSTTGYYLLHYLYTYDHGFISRGLVGEITSWFVQTVTPQVVGSVVLAGSFIMILGGSICIGYALWQTRSDKNLQYAIAVIVLYLVVTPVGFRSFYTDFKLDKLMWACTLFAVLCTESAKTLWLVPFFCLIATMINPVFLFHSMILISIILLDKALESKFSPYITLVCLLAYAGMIAMGLFSAISEQHLGFADSEEMLRFYFQRYSDQSVLDNAFLQFAEETWLYDFFMSNVLEIFKKSFQVYFLDWHCWRVAIFNTLFVVVPCYVLLGSFWKKCLRASENWRQRIVFFLCIISPAVLIAPCILSWDTSRCFYNNIRAQLCLILYFWVHKNPAVLNAKDETLRFCADNRMQTIITTVYLAMLAIPG